MDNKEGLYRSLSVDPRLRGHKPHVVIVDKNEKIYLSINDAIEVTKLSPERLRGLVNEERLIAIKPGGHDLFILLDSIEHYLTEGRKLPGRPSKRDS